MNIQQEQILAGELQSPTYTGLLFAREFAGVASLLNVREEIDNPEPQPDVPIQFTWNTFLALLSPGEILGLYGYGDLAGDLRNALLDNDRAEISALWRAIKSVMPPATITEVESAFAASEPDPSWQPTVLLPSRAQELGLPRITAQDVQTVWHRVTGE